MATGSGLDAQLTFASEGTWGTPASPTKAVEFNSESLNYTPTFLEPTGLRAGQKYKRVSRVRQSRTTVSGDVALEWATKGMGLLVKHMLGSPISAPAQIDDTDAYSQIHTPGDHRGMGLTVQVGRPEPSTGTVRPFTVSGCKVTKWQFEVKDNSIPTLTLTFDGKSQSTVTALATPAYSSGATVFDFSQTTLKMGGAAATASGETSISGGTAVATVVREFSLSGETGMAEDRFGLGNGGLKSEQLENAVPTITGSLTAEFNKVEFYDVFVANTTVALELVLEGEEVDGGSGAKYLLSFVIPASKFKTAQPAVSGPDIVQMKTDFEVYSDEANPVLQVKIVSDETVL